jgi:oligosaccharide repeat unit polymerase
MVCILLLAGALGVWGGREVFRQWTNPISVYVAMWVGSLILYCLDVVFYYPIHYETWIIVFASMASFVGGALIVPAMHYATWTGLAQTTKSCGNITLVSVGDVRIVLYVILGLAILAVAQLWYVELRFFGSVQRLFMSAESIYHQRVEQGIPGALPYVTSLTINAVFLAGVYTAMTMKVNVAAFLSLLVVAANEIAVMGRMRLIMSAFLFCCGFILTRKSLLGQKGKSTDKGARLRLALGAVSLLLILVASMEFIRITRGVVESFKESKGTAKLYQKGFLTSSTLPLYVTVHFAVLDQYFLEDREHTMWGANSFFPLYRFAKKFGVELDLPSNYQLFYRTPQGANTGTYLREVHADFGMPGLVVYPLLLGLISSASMYRFLVKRTHLWMVAGSWTLTLVMMAIFFVPTRAGDLLVAFCVQLIVAWWLGRRSVSPNGARPIP